MPQTQKQTNEPTPQNSNEWDFLDAAVRLPARILNTCGQGHKTMPGSQPESNVMATSITGVAHTAHTHSGQALHSSVQLCHFGFEQSHPTRRNPLAHKKTEARTFKYFAECGRTEFIYFKSRLILSRTHTPILNRDFSK